MTLLRQRLIDDLQVRNYSPRTVEAYVSAVVRLARHFNKSPDLLGLEEIRAFQIHLLSAKTSWSQFNQIVCGLRFFYRVSLHRPEVVVMLPYGKKPKSLPVVLSMEEVGQLLAVPYVETQLPQKPARTTHVRAETLGNAGFDVGREAKNAIYSPGGPFARLFPTKEDRVAFQNSEERTQIDALIDSLPNPPVRSERKEYSSKFNVRLPKSLHAALASEAESEGVSLNQLVLAKLAVRLQTH